jgi:hypothetical protein
MAEVSSLAAMTVVLVHGGFVDGSGWEAVRPFPIPISLLASCLDGGFP